jgi:hypothetical protein
VVFPTPPFPLATAMTGTCSEGSGIHTPGVREAEDLLVRVLRTL